MSVEKREGVHSKEKSQVKDRKKSSAEQYAEHSKLDYKNCNGDTWEDVTAQRVKVIDG